MLGNHLGRYQLVRRIGAGGMADVYLATTEDRRGAERRLALKVVHENHTEDREFVRALINEARLAVLLTHNNIVQVLDLGHVEGRYFVAMELVDGLDASELLEWSRESRTAIPYEITAFIVHQIGGALHYAHTRCGRDGTPLDIIHRDVSPQNILLGLAGEVKLTDFGIAKANVARVKTAANIVKGKYDYMSPEHAWGDELDARADIFSLGVVMYQLLTGRIPLEDPDDPADAIKRLTDLRRVPIPPARSLAPDVPGRLDNIVMTALARQRDDRYQNADEMRRDLEIYLGDPPGHYRDQLVRMLRRAFPKRAAAVEARLDATRVYTDTVVRKLDDIPRDTASLLFDVTTDVDDEPPTTLMDRLPSAPSPPSPPTPPPSPAGADQRETLNWTPPPSVEALAEQSLGRAEPAIHVPFEPTAQVQFEVLSAKTGPAMPLRWLAIGAAVVIALGVLAAFAVFR